MRAFPDDARRCRADEDDPRLDPSKEAALCRRLVVGVVCALVGGRLARAEEAVAQAFAPSGSARILDSAMVSIMAALSCSNSACGGSVGRAHALRSFRTIRLALRSI